jgi:hypothetical protein
VIGGNSSINYPFKSPLMVDRAMSVYFSFSYIRLPSQLPSRDKPRWYIESYKIKKGLKVKELMELEARGGSGLGPNLRTGHGRPLTGFFGCHRC